MSSNLPLHLRTTEFLIKLSKAQKPYRRVLYRHELGLLVPASDSLQVHLCDDVYAGVYLVKFFPGGDPAVRVLLNTRYYDSKRDLDETAEKMIAHFGWFE